MSEERTSSPQAEMDGHMVVAFALVTSESADHPHPEYNHRCDVSLFGEPVWVLWGKSAEDAERAARFEIKSRILRAIRG